MFESLVITLREGVEAALVLAIALAFLRRRNLGHLNGALFAGAGAALALSAVAAAWIGNLTYDQELAEGIAMLVGAVLVLTLVWWMWRAAPRMKHEIESGLGRIAGGEQGAGGTPMGVFAFAFFMVFREGIEAAVFLSAARFNSEGLLMWSGALVGVALAVGFGVLFVRGSLRVPLKPFFTVTTAVLALLAVRLLVGGLHELSEAQVLPSSKEEMALVGPFVKNELLLFTLTVAMVAVWLLVGGRTAEAVVESGGPEARLARARVQRDAARRRWSGIVGLLILGLLTTAFVQQSHLPGKAAATPLTFAGDEARFDAKPMADGRLHFFELTLGNRPVRFFAVKVGDEIRTCLDACTICGDAGYFEDGSTVVCRNCTSPIVRTSLGRKGGCNPVPLASVARAGAGGPADSIAITADAFRLALPRVHGH
jgi:FTR1 family protein